MKNKNKSKLHKRKNSVPIPKVVKEHAIVGLGGKFSKNNGSIDLRECILPAIDDTETRDD
jgi:hypothetical protein